MTPEWFVFAKSPWATRPIHFRDAKFFVFFTADLLFVDRSDALPLHHVAAVVQCGAVVQWGKPQHRDCAIWTHRRRPIWRQWCSGAVNGRGKATAPFRCVVQCVILWPCSHTES